MRTVQEHVDDLMLARRGMRKVSQSLRTYKFARPAHANSDIEDAGDAIAERLVRWQYSRWPVEQLKAANKELDGLLYLYGGANTEDVE